MQIFDVVESSTIVGRDTCPVDITDILEEGMNGSACGSGDAVRAAAAVPRRRKSRIDAGTIGAAILQWVGWRLLW